MVNAPLGPENALDLLVSLVSDDLRQVNETIIRRMHSPVVLIPKLASHIIAAGGKRLRPVLTLASARLCGYAGEGRHVMLATCIEFIHTATLLHDDVVDESALRRGKPSANVLWGNKASVLVGDFLFSRAFELMVEDGHLPVLAILSRASSVIAEGEVLQLLTANDTDTTEETYLEVIRSKTAALFAAASRLGPMVAGRPPEEEAAMEAYGLNLGMAFQLVDDVLDYSARQEKLGKTIGDDFREGKITLPVILGVAAADATERTFWRRTLEDLDQNEDDLPRALDLLQKHDCLEETLRRAHAYGDTARTALQSFPDSPWRRALLDVVTFCIERAY
ncbi:MAG: octaprenyl-diphosphate synthase [Rhodospirillaceae bacterium]|nr:MAG: octaprenyl-diphosphate synthase [Rhodospirillaceae bacterium]